MKKIITNEYYVACLVSLLAFAWGTVMIFAMGHFYFLTDLNSWMFLVVLILFMFSGLYVAGIFLKKRYALIKFNGLISVIASLYSGTFLALFFVFLYFDAYPESGLGFFLASVFAFFLAFLYFSFKLLLDGKFEIAGEKEKEKEMKTQSKFAYWIVVGVIPWLLFIKLLVMIGREI